MAIRISASDRAGSSARSARRGVDPGEDRQPARCRERTRGHAHATSWNDDWITFSSRQLAAAEVGDDAAVAEDVDVVAVLQLFDLGRVPEEGAALAAPPRG